MRVIQNNILMTQTVKLVNKKEIPNAIKRNDDNIVGIWFSYFNEYMYYSTASVIWLIYKLMNTKNTMSNKINSSYIVNMTLKHM